MTRRWPLGLLMVSFAIGFVVPFTASHFLGPIRIPLAAPASSPGAPLAVLGGPAPTATRPPVLPTEGSGRYVPARGSTARVGWRGQLVRYQAVVEDGGGVDPDAFAAAVDATLADPRGWTAGGAWLFQRVPPGAPADLVIHLTTPGTTEVQCALVGVRTGGEISCRGGRDVFINLKRWQLAVPWYQGDVADYRRMVVNHEVGHFLGHGHVLCPAPGSPAPVMQTQSIALNGCRPNPWPYPDGHTFLTGPLAPP
jgi:hypothetical protein